MAARRVQRIDTHGAAVFLAGERALKIKRAVQVPVSRLLHAGRSARRPASRNCWSTARSRHKSIAGWWRSARRADGSFALDGDGEVVEWALEMARFDERQTVDHLARGRRRSTSTLLHGHRRRDRGLASRRADRRHRAVDRVDRPDHQRQHRGVSRRRLSAASDRRARCAPAMPPSRASRALLEQRGAQGQVRRCHGDLHLDNIVVIDGQPVLFDAIEFDPLFASTDVLYDLGFALMDFLHYGRGDAANLVFNRYLGDHRPRSSRRAVGAAAAAVDARGDPRQCDAVAPVPRRRAASGDPRRRRRPISRWPAG